MNKKEKNLTIVSSIYLIGLLVLMVLILVFSFTNIINPGIFIIIFLLYLIIGYIIITLMKMNTYSYICPKCKKQHNLSFIQTIFASRGDNSRKLKCTSCNEVSYMERTTK